MEVKMEKEEIAALAAEAAAKVVEELKETDRKLTPGDDVKDVESPEDKIINDPKGGFKNMGHFIKDIIYAGHPDGNPSDSLKEWSKAIKTVMEEGDLSQGGYLVPEEFRATLLQTALEESIVEGITGAGKAVPIPMATNRVTIPALVDNDHSSGSYFGGITIYRPGEGESKTASKPKFGKVGLTLHKLIGLVPVTDELIQDSPISIEPIVKSTFGQAIAFVKDDDSLNGNGANQSLGAFNAANPSLIAVTKETGQPAATILYENIIKMWERLYPAGQKRSMWVANIECFSQLAQMSMAVGTGGVPVYMPAGGVSGSPYATLMGRPCIYSEKMQALGTQGDIGLADFSQYLIGEKAGGLQFAKSIHVYFVYDETAFRFVLRYDGQPWWLSALTPRRGNNTLSPFVVLEDRS
jgi:HK97 family phage major capsid protein